MCKFKYQEDVDWKANRFGHQSQLNAFMMTHFIEYKQGVGKKQKFS